MTILPFPLWPLAEHLEFGQNADLRVHWLWCTLLHKHILPETLDFFNSPPLHRLVTLLAHERKSAKHPELGRASIILHPLNRLARPLYSSGDPLRSQCLGRSPHSISLPVSFANKVLMWLYHCKQYNKRVFLILPSLLRLTR